MQVILFVHHANDMYGADIGLPHSIHSLDRTIYHPIVILPSDMPAPGMMSSELTRLGIETHFAPLGILRRKYFSARRLFPLLLQIVRGIAYVRKTARRRGAVVVYVNTISTFSGAIGGRLAGVPVLWHIREILVVPSAVRWILQNALRFCAGRVVCISNAVRSSLLKEAPYLAETSVVVYNAVTLPSSNSPIADNALRDEMGVPRDAPLVGMVGRITHWKGQEILAEAAGLVIKRYPTAHFLAVGSYFADQSHFLEKLNSVIDQFGVRDRFHLADYRTNVSDVYRALDIFVLPSRKPEPFGRVTVEAMMQGRPVIATNHGGTCELIEDGVTGLLVPPSDPEALTGAIERLLKDQELRDKLGRAAAVYAREHFLLSRYQKEIRDIIDDLAGGDARDSPDAKQVLKSVDQAPTFS